MNGLPVCSYCSKQILIFVLLKHKIFFQSPAGFTPGNATSGTARICDANAPEGKPAIFIIVRYRWSSRETSWAYKTSSVIYSSNKGKILYSCVKSCSLIIINSLFSRIIPRNKCFLKHYTALCWFLANTYYIKSVKKNKQKQMCTIMIAEKLYQVNAFVCSCSIKCTTMHWRCNCCDSICLNQEHQSQSMTHYL